MDQKEVPRDRLRLKEEEGLLSPPYLAQPYQCGTAVTVFGFVPHATIEIEVAGGLVVTQVVGFPEPVGATLALPAPLVAGEVVRARQSLGAAQSDWSAPVVVVDHTQEFPAGPPRPQISPAPVYRCGIRTGVGNLLAGGNVWITADGTEVGRVKGCASPQQGVNVSPAYGPNQHVRAWFELCGDSSPPSPDHLTQSPPSPLPTPSFDPIYAGGEQLRINNIVNGARVTLLRNGVPQGTWGCWGGTLLVGLTPPSVPARVSARPRRCALGTPPACRAAARSPAAPAYRHRG